MDFQLATLLKCLTEREVFCQANRPVVCWKSDRSTAMRKRRKNGSANFEVVERECFFSSLCLPFLPRHTLHGNHLVKRIHPVSIRQTRQHHNQLIIFPRVHSMRICLFRFSVTRWEFSFAPFACNSHSHIIFSAQCFTFYNLATGYWLPMCRCVYDLLSGGMRLLYIYTWLIFTLPNVSTLRCYFHIGY